VAETIGFDRQEALSLAHVHVHISSLKHALMLGNILNPQETKEAQEEMAELPDGGACKGQVWKAQAGFRRGGEGCGERSALGGPDEIKVSRLSCCDVAAAKLINPDCKPS
jgi:hypothetical protein